MNSNMSNYCVCNERHPPNHLVCCGKTNTVHQFPGQAIYGVFHFGSIRERFKCDFVFVWMLTNRENRKKKHASASL